MNQETLKPLLDAVTLLISQYRLEIAVIERQRTLRSIRILISQLIQDEIDQGRLDMRTLRDGLSKGLDGVRKTCTSGADAEQTDHMNYCLREVLMAVELADQICQEFHDRPEVARTLVEDLPILRPFDYGAHREKVEPTAKSIDTAAENDDKAAFGS
jgi:hypothetical protein